MKRALACLAMILGTATACGHTQEVGDESGAQNDAGLPYEEGTPGQLDAAAPPIPDDAGLPWEDATPAEDAGPPWEDATPADDAGYDPDAACPPPPPPCGCPGSGGGAADGIPEGG